MTFDERWSGIRIRTVGEVAAPYDTPAPGLPEGRSGLSAESVTHHGAQESVRRFLIDQVAGIKGSLVDLSEDLHRNPELGYQEHHAVTAVAATLAEHGVDVEVGAFGLPTALRAVSGRGGPCVAFMAEYDALPGIGHACGHNIIAASSVGAFLAVARLVADRADGSGSVMLVGTPAEEGGGGKQRILDAGGFDGVDLAMLVHPSNTDRSGSQSLGFRQISVTYHGRASHAATSPELGQNALDAVVTAYNGIAQLRQHILPTDRVHGIITDGGEAANIVPERASATFYVRSMTLPSLAHLFGRVDTILQSAALQTGTVAEIVWDEGPPYLPLRENRTIEGRYAHNWTDVRGDDSIDRLPASAASTDVGNVSVYVPAIQPLVAIAPTEVANHTHAFTAFAQGERANTAIVDSATTMALTAADFLFDAGLRTAARAEFDRLGGPMTISRALQGDAD